MATGVNHHVLSLLSYPDSGQLPASDGLGSARYEKPSSERHLVAMLP